MFCCRTLVRLSVAFELSGTARVEDLIKHAEYLLGEERHRPTDQVQVVWETVGRFVLLILLQLQVALLKDEDGGLIVVRAAIVGG